jgi:hypothetical protein
LARNACITLEDRLADDGEDVGHGRIVIQSARARFAAVSRRGL